MNILETITTYWNEFATIYSVVLGYGAWNTVTILTPTLLTLGIIRCAYHYAKGDEIRQLNHGMFVLRLGDKLVCLLGWQENTEFRVHDGWADGRSQRTYKPIPIGSSFIGMILDVGAFTLISLVVFLIWPAVAFISVTLGPLHICRVHSLRKKAFIANLKGKEVNA